MSAIIEHWPSLLAMSALMLLSAFFSGSEAALFSLHATDRRRLARGGTAGRLAANLLNDSERLLSAVLFWNLLINMTYFGLASIIGGKLESSPEAGSSIAVAFTILSLLMLIFFSEMLPKSIAVLAPVPISMFVGAPLALALRIVGPLLPLVKVANLAASRLIWPTFEPEAEIDLSDIERAIELGTDDAVLRRRERLVLRGLVEMADMRVDELMWPRSKLTLISLPLDRGVLARGIPASGYLMVTSGDGEMILSAIGIRMLRPSQMDDIPGAAEPVIYVGWSARVSQVLDLLQKEDRSVAIVVNEFGEEIGALTNDDIMRRILTGHGGRDEEAGEGAAIQPLEEGGCRFAGSVSVRSLAKFLGLDVPEERTATVAGFIQRHNERRPRLGDIAPLEHYELTVVAQDDDSVIIEARPITNTDVLLNEGDS